MDSMLKAAEIVNINEKIIDVNSEMQEIDECPCNVSGTVYFIGKDKDKDILILTSTDPRQPCIGPKTRTNLSYGRYEEAGRTLSKIVIKNCTVKCEGINKYFTLGEYGSIEVPKIEIENGALICPETLGTRVMVYNAAIPEGSTKIYEDPYYYVQVGNEEVPYNDLQNSIIKEYSLSKNLFPSWMSPTVMKKVASWDKDGIDTRPLVEAFHNSCSMHDSERPNIIDYCGAALLVGVPIDELKKNLIDEPKYWQDELFAIWQLHCHYFMLSEGMGNIPAENITTTTIIDAVRAKYTEDYIRACDPNDQKLLDKWTYFMDPYASIRKEDPFGSIANYFFK